MGVPVERGRQGQLRSDGPMTGAELTAAMERHGLRRPVKASTPIEGYAWPSYSQTGQTGRDPHKGK